MTRKDYVRLAAALAEANTRETEESRYQWVRCVHLIAATLRSDNPRFDTDKFLAACGRSND